jgi:hypothetical protein
MSTIGFIGVGAMRSRIAGLLLEKHIRRARQVADGLGFALPSAAVAERCSPERQLGYAHRHLTAPHEMLAGSLTA